MACVRRRIKRGMILVLACYATFLLLSVHSWFDGSLSQSATDTENGAQVKVQQVSVIKKDVQPDLDQNDVIEDGDVPGGSEKRHPNSVLLPEELDMAIQQQPVGRAVRKKLSQPHPQQLNVVVEDAPPGTFVKRYYPPESDSGFRDLDPAAAAPASSNRRFQELRFLGEREIGLKSGNQEEGEEQVNSLQPGRGQGDSEEDRVAVAHKDKHQELIQKTNNKRGAWISPDGSPDDLNAGSDMLDNGLRFKPLAPTPNPWTPAPPLTAAMLNISVSRTAANFKEIADVSIYSAFFDDRTKTPHVRMMAVGPISRRPSTSDLWCVFSSRQSVEPVQVVFHQTADCKRMKKHCFYVLSCQVPPGAEFSPSKSDNSLAVVIGKRENNFLNQSGERVRLDVIVNKKRSTNQIASNEYSSASPTFSVCVPPLYGKLNVLQFVEFVELNRLFGAVHFTFYKFRVSREIARVLSYYEESGVVRVLPWNLPAPNDIWYKGQSVAIGDCLYRNMHLFDFVAFQDLDEFFVPAIDMSWQEMFEKIHSQSENVDTIAAIYQFPSILFYAAPSVKELTNEKAPHGVLDSSELNSEAAKFLTLKSTLRANGSSSDLTKMFVKPERVLELDLHTMVKPVSDSFVAYKVDPLLGSVHHYRYLACTQAVSASTNAQDCAHLVQNRTVWRFKDDLIWRTKNTLQGLNRLGTSFT